MSGRIVLCAFLFVRKPKPLDQCSRQTRYYHAVRDAIFLALGRVCKNCGRTKELEFDVVIPQDGAKDHHAKMSQTSRAAFYKRQHAAGNLQVLCTHCNSSKKDRDEVQIPMYRETPRNDGVDNGDPF